MGARHRRRKLTRRGRGMTAAGLVVVLALGAFAGYRALRGTGIIIPSDSCAERPPLITYQGVRLQPLAMTAFKKAERQAGRQIPVVQSYRSCAEQRMACKGICGDPNGCAGTCAPPGKSWHQLGAAIDVEQAGIDDGRIVSALKTSGWCQPLPGSDPGHFSYGGCH